MLNCCFIIWPFVLFICHRHSVHTILSCIDKILCIYLYSWCMLSVCSHLPSKYGEWCCLWMPFHTNCHAMPLSLPHPAISANAICHVISTCKWAPLLKQLDAITLSPAHDHDRGCARMAGHSFPTKRPCIQSLSQSQSRSRSHSPPCHCRCHYVSPNMHGRCACLTLNSKGKGKGSNPPFFQSGTAGSGTSTCAVCLGRHKHEYAKCPATKLWNGKQTFVRRSEQGGLVFLDRLPICFNFQTMVGCPD